MEQKANLYGTVVSSVPITTLVPSITLMAPYVAGSGIITPTSQTGAPGSGTFSLTIFNAETGAVYLIFRVTGISGPSFTGAAEGPDSNAPLGAAIAGTMITAAALTQIQADTQTAVIAAINAGGVLVNAALPDTAVIPGSYTSTDLTVNSKGVITAAANGSGGGGGFIQPLTPPIPGSFSPINFNTGGCTTTQVNNTNSISLAQSDPGASQEIAGLTKAPINVVFTLTIGFAMSAGGSTGSQNFVGLWLTDGSAQNILFGYQSADGGWSATLFGNFSGSFSLNIYGIVTTQAGTPMNWVRVQETLTQRIYSVSADGINFIVLTTESNTAHFVTAQYGFASANRNNAAQSQIVVYSLVETTP